MILTVKLGQDNFITDKHTGEIVERYDPANKDVELTIKLPDSTLIVDGTNIQQQYGGNIIVQYNNDRFIIDDGYQNTLIKCGYIVYKEYDYKKIKNKSTGDEIRDMIIESIRALLPEISEKYNKPDTCIESTLKYNGNESILILGNEEDHFTYMIKFNTVNFIVNKNHIRKDNDLPFYPFDKSMDKYGTIYVSVFAQKNFKVVNDPDKYTLPESAIKDLVFRLGKDYHFTSLPVKNRIIYWPGL